MKYAVFVSTANGCQIASRICALNDDKHIDVFVHCNTFSDYVKTWFADVKSRPDNIKNWQAYHRLSDQIGMLFNRYDAMIFVMATGIVVRTIAPHIVSKASDPAVIVMDDRARNIISLLSGHLGGANLITGRLAEQLGGNPVITTATDVNQLLAPDSLAVKLDMVPYPKKNLVVFNSGLLRGKKLIYLLDETIRCVDEYQARLRRSHVEYELVRPEDIERRLSQKQQDNLYVVLSEDDVTSGEDILYLKPRKLIAGVGCRRNTSKRLVLEALERACAEIGWGKERLNQLASTVVKSDEQGLLRAAGNLGLPIAFFENEELKDKIDRYGLEESSFVNRTIGVGNVCEASALCCVESGRIAMPKTKYEKVTVALIWQK